MKIHRQIIGFVLLATVLTMLAPTEFSDTRNQPANPETEKCFFSVCNDHLNNQFGKNESIGHNFSQIPAVNLKNKAQSFNGQIELKEFYLHNKISKYIFQSRRTTVRMAPANIIFPFNYFW